jgi:hypothetical protein
METKFNLLYENLLERYQQGGYLIGDRVRFRKDCLNLEFFKNKAKGFVDLIKSCMQEGFDLNLRISAIKSIRPTTTQNYRGGTDSPDNLYADIVIEYAPGLYRNPMTVPIESFELMEDGINTGPVPDSIKRKSVVDIKPVEVETEGTENVDVNLNNKNVKIGGNKYNDKAPSNKWKPLPKNKKH